MSKFKLTLTKKELTLISLALRDYNYLDILSDMRILYIFRLTNVAEEAEKIAKTEKSFEKIKEKIANKIINSEEDNEDL